MPTWAILTLALGSGAVAAAAVLTAVRLQLRHARREREAIASAQRREKGAAVLAPVLSVLQDAEPGRLAAARDTQTLTLMNELRERWAQMRDPLLAYGMADPSPQVAELARELAVAVSNSITSTHWLVHDLPESWSTEALETAKADHATASARASRLLEELRGRRG